MGEWSEYFEDFPEENPANYYNGCFDPDGLLRRQQAAYEMALRRLDEVRKGKVLSKIIPRTLPD